MENQCFLLVLDLVLVLPFHICVALEERFQISPFDFYSLISYFNTILLQLKRKSKIKKSESKWICVFSKSQVDAKMLFIVYQKEAELNSINAWMCIRLLVWNSKKIIFHKKPQHVLNNFIRRDSKGTSVGIGGFLRIEPHPPTSRNVHVHYTQSIANI